MSTGERLYWSVFLIKHLYANVCAHNIYKLSYMVAVDQLYYTHFSIFSLYSQSARSNTKRDAIWKIFAFQKVSCGPTDFITSKTLGWKFEQIYVIKYYSYTYFSFISWVSIKGLQAENISFNYTERYIILWNLNHLTT